jgi:hypothetical protein
VIFRASPWRNALPFRLGWGRGFPESPYFVIFVEDKREAVLLPSPRPLRTAEEAQRSNE